ncbi:MAG: bifunctional DNA-formamidopyrimidine glycosylase/DNA-(apurinic or apyrimidinic site) lyase [Phycisphaerae bacterium]|jgi:formamidopyrimidine-DNA glycosylase
MPELPEVETIVRTFAPDVEGRRIVGFASRWPRQATPSVGAIRRGVVGRTVVRLARRGKFIVFHLDPPGYLLLHLRMSGRLEWQPAKGRPPRHVRTTWDLDNGRRLLLCDARKFARLTYVDDLAAATAELGIEPLGRLFTAARLHQLLDGRNRQLKALLLDQSVIAGLGNIYTDEALFRAGLHPLARAGEVTPAQVASLHGAIRDVLREAIRRHGTTIDWIYPGGWMQNHLNVYGRAGEPCRRCGTPIEALRAAGRGTHVCPRCQPR